MSTRATRLDLASHEHTVIYLNGRLVAECVAGTAQDRDSLESEVRKARSLRSLARFVGWLPDEIRKAGDIADHVNARGAARQQAFVRGVLDGLERKTEPYPGEPGGIVPSLPLEHTAAYRAGYQVGEAIARAVAIANEGEGERINA